MKKRFVIALFLVLTIMVIGCNKKENLENMTSVTKKDYVAIVWNDKTYIPFSAVDNSERGKQIGIVNKDKNDQVYEYKGYSSDEWIISFYYSGEMDTSMLMREVNVKDTPKGLYSEYEWNKDL